MSAELNKLAAQIVTRVRQYGEYRDKEAADDVAAMIRRTVEAQSADVGELPPPDCTYADHSYPAYSRKAVEAIVRAALKGKKP